MISGVKNLEGSVRKFLDSDDSYAKATKIALAILAIGGIMIIGAMAPGIFQAFGKFRRARKYSPQQLRGSIYTLSRQGYVEIIREKDDKTIIRLTNKGRERIKEFSIESISINKQDKWDGKWRVVIFDIPVKFNKAREALRKKLKNLNFYQLQKSVWFYPYPCEDEILFLSNIFRIESFVEIFTADNLLHENKLKRFFKL